jgi:hypothetical protein
MKKRKHIIQTGGFLGAVIDSVVPILEKLFGRSAPIND